MHNIVMIAAVAALAGCSQEAATPAAETNVATADANLAAPVTPAAMSLNETTWTFSYEGKNIEESIDAAGNYIATVGAAHEDHGTYAVVDGKACFTSAMNEDGPECWTVVDTAIGQTTETVNDKGEKLMVTRVAYVPKQMPAAT